MISTSGSIRPVQYLFASAFLMVLLPVLNLVLVPVGRVGLHRQSNTRTSLLPGCNALSTASSTGTSTTVSSTRSKILVLGGTGFLGSEIVNQAQSRSDVDVVCTSASGKDGALTLDLTSADAGELVRKAAEGCVGVISTVGSIGTKYDRQINSATAVAARAARAAGVKHFVSVGNNERVRGLTKSMPFLTDYAEGKEESERAIRELYGYNGCIVQPSFIYGGNKYGISPPRVASPVGALAEEVLGLYPIQALSKALPDALGAPLEPPVSVESTAGACLNVALGICEGYTVLDSKDSIVMAATAHRPRGCIDEEECSVEEEAEIQSRRDYIKRMLQTPNSGQDDIALMEELESLRARSTKPAYDASLNSRWDFVLSKSDLGTDLLKKLKPEEGFSPLQLAYAVRDVYMEISEEQSQVKIVLKSKILGRNIDVALSTSLLPMAYDDETDGTLFVERFEGVKVGDVDMPIPKSWKRSRYLEIGYLDHDMMIARGNGGEPHFLLRGRNRPISSD